LFGIPQTNFLLPLVPPFLRIFPDFCLITS
jgi:hypothetical protein